MKDNDGTRYVYAGVSEGRARGRVGIAIAEQWPDFSDLCVARCRHDYGLRTSVAKEVKGQMLIVTVFYQIVRPNLGPS